MSVNKTPDAQLNQWVLSDPVRMEDFNADNAKIDFAISELSGKIANLSATLSGFAESLPLVKLIDITTQYPAAQVDLNLTDVNLSRFSAVFLTTNVQSIPFGIYQNIFVRINNSGGATRSYNSSVSGNYLGFIPDAIDSKHGGSTNIMLTGFQKTPGVDEKNIFMSLKTVSMGNFERMDGAYFWSDSNPNFVLNFVVSDAANAIPAGTRFTVYGIKY